MNSKWRLGKTVYGRKYDKITRERDPGEDLPHLAWLHTIQCCAVTYPIEGATPCQGPPVAHHSTRKRGRGQKAPDREAMPMCDGHHKEFHAGSQTFKRWKKARRAEWQDRMVTIYKTGKQ